MRDARELTTAVVGGSGFVGRVLLRELAQHDVSVAALARGLPELADDSGVHAMFSSVDELGGKRFEQVINLAYPSSGPVYEYPAQHAKIFDTVDRLLVDGGHLIHVSTQVVFGAALDRPIAPGPVGSFRDDPYVEAKVAAENDFRRLQRRRGLRLDIVRLGNVWGFGSGWALAVVQRLITGRPVAVEGRVGFSNVTDVSNTASYLRHLGQRNGQAQDVEFHHIAEFSATRWPDWVAPIAAELGVDVVAAPSFATEGPASIRAELREALAPVRPRALYQTLAGERRAGSLARSALRRLPAKTFDRLKGEDAVWAPGPVFDRDEQAYLTLMSSPVEFRSVVDSAWAPPLSEHASAQGVAAWLAELT
jgi:nucleoside-diphosphate-sugar epimerase